MKKEKELSDGWSRWIPPTPNKPYRLGCCDCGLVHDTEFQVVEVLEHTSKDTFHHGPPLDPTKYRVLFRARRNNRSTAQLRRHL